MRAHLCRLLLYLPSTVLYLKLQLQNLCHFRLTLPLKAFLSEYHHFFCFCCCILFQLPVYAFFLNMTAGVAIFSFTLRYVMSTACYGGEITAFEGVLQKVFPSSGKMAFPWTLHQFVEVEINMTVPYLFR